MYMTSVMYIYICICYICCKIYNIYYAIHMYCNTYNLYIYIYIVIHLHVYIYIYNYKYISYNVVIYIY